MDLLDAVFAFYEKGSKNLSECYKRAGSDRKYSEAQRQKAKELSLEYKERAREIHERREEYRKNK